MPFPVSVLAGIQTMRPAPEQPALLKGVVDPRDNDFGVSRTDGGGCCWAISEPLRHHWHLRLHRAAAEPRDRCRRLASSGSLIELAEQGGDASG